MRYSLPSIILPRCVSIFNTASAVVDLYSRSVTGTFTEISWQQMPSTREPIGLEEVLSSQSTGVGRCWNVVLGSRNVPPSLVIKKKILLGHKSWHCWDAASWENESTTRGWRTVVPRPDSTWGVFSQIVWPIPLQTVYGCFADTPAGPRSWLYGLQSLTYWLPGFVQEKLADTWSIVKDFLEVRGWRQDVKKAV